MDKETIDKTYDEEKLALYVKEITKYFAYLIAQKKIASAHKEMIKDFIAHQKIEIAFEEIIRNFIKLIAQNPIFEEISDKKIILALMKASNNTLSQKEILDQLDEHRNS